MSYAVQQSLLQLSDFQDLEDSSMQDDEQDSLYLLLEECCKQDVNPHPLFLTKQTAISKPDVFKHETHNVLTPGKSTDSWCEGLVDDSDASIVCSTDHTINNSSYACSTTNSYNRERFSLNYSTSSQSKRLSRRRAEKFHPFKRAERFRDKLPFHSTPISYKNTLHTTHKLNSFSHTPVTSYKPNIFCDDNKKSFFDDDVQYNRTECRSPPDSECTNNDSALADITPDITDTTYDCISYGDCTDTDSTLENITPAIANSQCISGTHYNDATKLDQSSTNSRECTDNTNTSTLGHCSANSSESVSSTSTLEQSGTYSSDTDSSGTDSTDTDSMECQPSRDSTGSKLEQSDTNITCSLSNISSISIDDIVNGGFMTSTPLVKHQNERKPAKTNNLTPKSCRRIPNDVPPRIRDKGTVNYRSHVRSLAGENRQKINHIPGFSCVLCRERIPSCHLYMSHLRTVHNI